MESGILTKVPLRIRKNDTQIIRLEKDPILAIGVNGILSYQDLYRKLKVTSRIFLKLR